MADNQITPTQNTPAKLWRVIDIINWAKKYFEDNDVDSPRLTIEYILCEVLSYNRVTLYLHHEQLLSTLQLSVLRSMILQRVKDRRPLQYILGHTEFMGLKFLTNESALIPRPETELLVEYACNTISDVLMNSAHQEQHLRLLDIGTGTGCIAISIAKKFPKIQIVALDISDEAIELAKANAELHAIENITFLVANIFDFNVSIPFNIVVSNPPYISQHDMNDLSDEVRLHEPHLSLTDASDGLSFYRYLSKSLPEYLTDNGIFFLEIGFGQKLYIEQLFSNFHLVRFYNDFAQIPRIIFGHVVHNSE